MWDDRNVRNGAVNIAVRDYGGTGRGIVLVHGGPGQNLATWDEFAPALWPELRPIAVDMRGNGASDDASEYGWPALVSDIHAVVREFELQRPVLLGHSWGGQLVTYSASQYHDCGGVIAVDGWITDVRAELGDNVWQWIEDDYASDPFIGFCGTSTELERALTDVLESFGASAAAVARRQFVEGSDGSYRGRRTAKQLVQIQRAVDQAAAMLSSAVYANIDCPVLLIGGETSEERVQAARQGMLGDWAFSKRATDPIALRYANVMAEWWPCGHDIPAEMPRELAARTKSFAAALP